MSDILYESQRIVATNNEEKIEINSPADIEKIKQVMDIKDKVQEHFLVITLNVKNIVNSIELVGLGSSTSASVNAGDVMRCALLRNTSSIILVHNHPSGDVTPSKHDLYLTKQLNSMARLFNIRLADHIIIGDRVLSMLREKLIDVDRDIEKLKNDVIQDLQEENKKLRESLEEKESIKEKIERAKRKVNTKQESKGRKKQLEQEV